MLDPLPPSIIPPLPFLREALFEKRGDDASRPAALACATRALRCDGFVGLDVQQCAQMRAMQLLLPGARLRPHFARAAYATVHDAWLGNLHEVSVAMIREKKRSRISRDSESRPRRVFGARDRRAKGSVHELVAQKETSPRHDKKR